MLYSVAKAAVPTTTGTQRALVTGVCNCTIRSGRGFKTSTPEIQDSGVGQLKMALVGDNRCSSLDWLQNAELQRIFRFSSLGQVLNLCWFDDQPIYAMKIGETYRYWLEGTLRIFPDPLVHAYFPQNSARNKRERREGDGKKML